MRTSKFLSNSAIIAVAASAHSAEAQTLDLDDRPTNSAIDAVGVDRIDGSYHAPSPVLTIGGQGGLRHSRYRVANGWRHNHLLTVETSSMYGQIDNVRTVHIGAKKFRFIIAYDTGGQPYFVDLDGQKAALQEQGGTFTLTSANGSIYTFESSLVANGESYYGPVSAIGTKVQHPNGDIVDLHYKNSSYNSSGLNIFVVRLQSVTNNSGYQLKFKYAENSLSELTVDDWYRTTRITALNAAVEYCDPDSDACSFVEQWPSLSYSATSSGNDDLDTVTDALARTVRFRSDQDGKLIGIKRPSQQSDGIEIDYWPNGRVSAVTLQGQYTREYGWQVDGSGNWISTSTDYLTRNDVVVSDPANEVVLSVENAVGDVTTFEYDSSNLLTKTVFPEGNSTELVRDLRGRVVERKSKPKPGSSLPDIVTSWTYPPLLTGIQAQYCANSVTCDRPNQMTDPRGKVYTYTWDSTHGGLLSQKAPNDLGGHAPETRYTYANLYAKKKNSSGTMVSFSDPITKLWKVKTCRQGEAPSCEGTANERITELYYNNNIEPNLNAASVKIYNGLNSISYTTKFTYNDLAQVDTIDGPLSGTGDTSTIKYDVVGQVIGQISPDPDGTSGLQHVATRYTYNEDGQVSVTEGGTVASPSDTDFASMTVLTKAVTAYDAFGRVETAAQVAPTGTTQYSIMQYSYDLAGRLDCTAIRMNAPNTTVSLPSDACTPMTAGSFGPDRISRNYYDEADRPIQVWSGIGTSIEQQSAEMSYNANGTLAWVEDAKDNRTAYSYDGHDRSYKIEYPSESTPGTVNTGDYEELVYDLASNITSHRTRRGETITFQYDNLNRVTRKNIPNRPGLDNTHTRDVRYSLDLYGNVVSAWFDGTPNDRVTLYFNSLGQLNRESRIADGVTRDVRYQYDSAGRLSRITHPDNSYWRYSYDNMGRFDLLRDNGTAGLVDPSYNSDGTVATVARLSSAPDNKYYYDGALRSDRILTDHSTASQDVNRTWDFNPANQAITEATDNQSHVVDLGITGPIDTPYVPDGLNQYDTVDGNTFTHDDNGNLSQTIVDSGSGPITTNYVYDVENRLVSVSGGHAATLRYDPFGRLHEVEDGSSNKRRMLYSGSDLIAEYNAGGTILDRYVHGLSAGDDALIHYPGSGTATSNAQFLYGDMRGSIVASYKADGSQMSLTPYDEYGVHGGASPGRFGYTSQVWVPEAGLYYYKARMYSPSLGRFMQTDPIGYADGLNSYEYVSSDPINWADASGLSKGARDFGDGVCGTSGGDAIDCPGDGGPVIVVTGSLDFTVPFPRRPAFPEPPIPGALGGQYSPGLGHIDPPDTCSANEGDAFFSRRAALLAAGRAAERLRARNNDRRNEYGGRLTYVNGVHHSFTLKKGLDGQIPINVNGLLDWGWYHLHNRGDGKLLSNNWDSSSGQYYGDIPSAQLLNDSLGRFVTGLVGDNGDVRMWEGTDDLHGDGEELGSSRCP